MCFCGVLMGRREIRQCVFVECWWGGGRSDNVFLWSVDGEEGECSVVLWHQGPFHFSWQFLSKRHHFPLTPTLYCEHFMTNHSSCPIKIVFFFCLFRFDGFSRVRSLQIRVLWRVVCTSRVKTGECLRCHSDEWRQVSVYVVMVRKKTQGQKFDFFFLLLSRKSTNITSDFFCFLSRRLCLHQIRSVVLLFLPVVRIHDMALFCLWVLRQYSITIFANLFAKKIFFCSFSICNCLRSNSWTTSDRFLICLIYVKSIHDRRVAMLVYLSWFVIDLEATWLIF